MKKETLDKIFYCDLVLMVITIIIMATTKHEAELVLTLISIFTLWVLLNTRVDENEEVK